jgi:hypothetical protein
MLCRGLVHGIAQETCERRKTVKDRDIGEHFFYHPAFRIQRDGYLAALALFRRDRDGIPACPGTNDYFCHDRFHLLGIMKEEEAGRPGESTSLPASSPITTRRDFR